MVVGCEEELADHEQIQEEVTPNQEGIDVVEVSLNDVVGKERLNTTKLPSWIQKREIIILVELIL